MDFIQHPSNPIISPLSCLHWQLHWQSKSWEVVHVLCIDSHWFWTMCWCQLDSVTGIFLHQLHGEALLSLASITRSYWFYSDHTFLLIDMYGALFGYLPALYPELSLEDSACQHAAFPSFHPVQHCTSLLSQLNVCLPNSVHSFPVINNSINDVIQCGICHLSSIDPTYFSNLIFLTSLFKKKKSINIVNCLRCPLCDL